MAKGKIHKFDEEPGLQDTALCGQGHRKLLPLRLDDDWRRVTCERCLKRRPSNQSLWDRFLASPVGTARGWFYRVTGRKQR